MIKSTLKMERAVKLRVSELKIQISVLLGDSVPGGPWNPEKYAEAQPMIQELALLTHPDSFVRLTAALAFNKIRIDEIFEQLEE